MSIAAPTVPVRCRRPGCAPRVRRVLLLHGLAGSTWIWNALAEQAAPALELWEADLPWATDGEWAQSDEVHRWIGAAIDGVDGRLDAVIAHSFAANALLELLDRSGGDGTPVVLVAPFYRPRPDAFDWATISYYLCDFHRILEEGVRVRSGARACPQVQAEIALRVQDRIGPYGWMRFFETYLRTPRLATAQMTQPTLVVCAQDDIAAPATDGSALARALPDCRLETLADCGHFPMVEQPEHFTRLVNRFLEELNP